MDRVEKITREEKQPVLDNNQNLFEWLPGKDIEDIQHEPIIQEEEEPHENRDQQEENYITDLETIGDKEEEGNILEINESVEDIMNNSE